VPIYDLICEGGHRSETLQASDAPLPACFERAPLRGGDPRGGPQPPTPPRHEHHPMIDGVSHLPGGVSHLSVRL
jgi:hypothetical protein